LDEISIEPPSIRLALMETAHAREMAKAPRQVEEELFAVST